MPLLYAPAAVSLPVLVAALAVFKKQWREWVVALGGYLLPLAFASYLYWGAGYDFLWLGRLAVDGIRDYLTLPGGAFFRTWNDPALLVFWGIWAAITVWAVLTFFLTARTMRVRPYKASLFFFWMLLLLLLLFAAPGRSIRIFPLVAVPSAVFIPLFFKKRIDRVSNLAYLLLFGSVVCYNLLPFFLGE